MNSPVKQHLIDPEICIRCYTCEMTCPIGAIQHDDNNVVVDPDICNFCMDCIPVCPTGSIDEWRVVATPYSLSDQYGFEELPTQDDIQLEADPTGDGLQAHDAAIAALLAEAHRIAAVNEFNGNQLINGSDTVNTALNANLDGDDSLLEAADGFHSIEFKPAVGDAAFDIG